MKSDSGPCKPGRPRGFCAETALSKALEVFWRKGFHGTSLTDLTEAMGINRPSLYAAYGNKESLFRLVMNRYAEQSRIVFEQNLAAAPTARQAVEQVLRGVAAAAGCGDHPAGCFLVQNAGASSIGDDDPMRRDIHKLRGEAGRIMQARIERAIADGEVSPETDAAALAAFYLTVLHGMSLQAAGGATAEALYPVVDTAMRAWPENRVGSVT